MERYNFKLIESKWQNYWEKEKANKVQIDKTKKNFTVLKCSLTHQEKYIWVT